MESRKWEQIKDDNLVDIYRILQEIKQHFLQSLLGQVLELKFSFLNCPYVCVCVCILNKLSSFKSFSALSKLHAWYQLWMDSPQITVNFLVPIIPYAHTHTHAQSKQFIKISLIRWEPCIFKATTKQNNEKNPPLFYVTCP